MADNVVVMPGSGQVDLPTLHSVAGEFGWVVVVAQDLREVMAAQASGKTVAVLFHRDALGPDYDWLEAIRLWRLELPEADVVACHGFSESIDWVELSNAGAFHALQLPLKESEVRQSLGFVWQAEKRLASSRALEVSMPSSGAAIRGCSRLSSRLGRAGKRGRS
jgi:DNA-binding NtrC family response regulator